jgi:hypothetical protein
VADLVVPVPHREITELQIPVVAAAVPAKVMELAELAARELLSFVIDTIKYLKGECYGTITI